MKPHTRELILSDIDRLNDIIDLNKRVDENNPEFKEFHDLENELSKASIKLLKMVLIKDDVNVVFTFTNQL